MAIVIAFGVPWAWAPRSTSRSSPTAGAGTTACSRSTSRTSRPCRRSSTASSASASSCTAPTSGRVVLAGGLILTLLVLPTIIIAAREAIRSVPQGFRLGPSRSARRTGRSSRGRCCRRHPGHRDRVDPRALARDRRVRAADHGGRVAVRARDPTLLAASSHSPCRSTTGSACRRPEFHGLAAAAIVVLLALLLTMNAVAILLRNRFQRRW